MFLKNNFRHAFAGADGHTTKSNVTKNAFMFSETDEVADFGTTRSSSRNDGKAPNKNNSNNFNAKPVVIAVIAFIAIILLVVGVVFVASSISKDVKCEDNSFIAYKDYNDVSRVAVNGKPIAEYEGEIELIVADDCSFAYVIETTEDGEMLYVLDTKEQTTITLDPVAKILDTASLKPGAIWYDANDNRVYHYTEERGTDTMLSKASERSFVAFDEHYFLISGDGETVVFYRSGAAENTSDKLMMYKDHQESPVINKGGYIPVSISDNGEVIYVKNGPTEDSGYTLHVITVIDDIYSTYPVTKNFSRMIAMNKDGDEIVYTTMGEKESTFVLKLNLKRIDDEISPKKVGKNLVFAPVDPKGEIARFDTFEQCFFQIENDVEYYLADSANYLYYLDSYDDPEVARVSKTPGKFSPNGKRYFAINKDGIFGYYDLTNKASISEFNRIRVSEGDINDFAVTQKGNVYLLSENRLMYYDLSKEKATPIHNSVSNISMHTAANILYFTTEGTLGVFTTKEGAQMEKADMGSVTPTALPVFVDANSKDTFAGYYDADNAECVLIYTSNGKRFKHISECLAISGVEFVDPTPDVNIPTNPETPDTSDTSDTSGNG